MRRFRAPDIAVGMLQVGGDADAGPADLGADLVDVDLRLQGSGRAGVADQNRDFEGDAQLKIVALETREELVVVVEAREQRVLGDQIGLGKALRFVTLDFQILGLQVGFQPPDLAVAIEGLLDGAFFRIELAGQAAIFLRRVNAVARD